MENGGGGKLCPDCGETKSLAEYRLSHHEVEKMIADQHGLCVVCWSRPPEHVDHCHRTGEVRYALCLPCNTGIGQFRDDSLIVWRALSYLEDTYEELELSEEELTELARAEDRKWFDFLSEATMI